MKSMKARTRGVCRSSRRVRIQELAPAPANAADLVTPEAIKQYMFGTLVVFDAPPIMGPEVEESMHRSAKQRAERGMLAVAFVTQSTEGLAVANAQWGRVYAGTGVEFRTFHDLASARTWLQELLDRAR